MRSLPRLAPALLAAALISALALTSVAAAKAPVIHAHRGGSLVDGKPRFPENTLPAFRHAALTERAVLEFDVRLTEDRVPVVIHDQTLERTTNCRGVVAETTLRELRRCRVDVLGAPGNGFPSRRVRDSDVRVPTLREVLAFARTAKATINLEIKNVPGDAGYDPTPGFANRVMDVVVAAGLARKKIIIQSFIPQNLDVARQRIPGVALSFLTNRAGNGAAVPVATSNDYRWVSPAWPVDAQFIQSAHAAGKRVVPYTLNRRADVRAAQLAGVDAVITDDPVMARKAVGLTAPPGG